MCWQPHHSFSFSIPIDTAIDILNMAKITVFLVMALYAVQVKLSGV